MFGNHFARWFNGRERCAPKNGPVRRSRRPRFEALEERALLTTTLYIDYGDRFPDSGLLQTTVGALDSTVFDPNPAITGDESPDVDGPRLVDANGMTYADDTTLVVRSLATDYGANAPAMRQTMDELVRRFFEPLDVTVVDLTADVQWVNGHPVQAAGNLMDISRTLGANEGDLENNDAYIIVGTFIIGPDPDPSDGIQEGGNPQDFPSPGGYGGLATGTDKWNDSTAESWFNDHDGTAIVCLPSDGTDASTRLLRRATAIAHEAGHLLGLRHTFGNNPATPPAASGIDAGLLQSDLMSYLRDSGFNFFSRYPMVAGDGNTNNNVLSAPTTPFDQLRFDGHIGPSSTEYVTGTGRNDIISIRRYNDYLANVSVQAFTDLAYTSAIIVPGYTSTSSIYSYLIPLDRPLLIDAGAGNDRIVLDGDLGVSVTLRGMAGTDELVIQGKNAAAGRYTPGTNNANGLDGNPDLRGTIVVGNTTVNFQEFENAMGQISRVTVQDVVNVMLQTPLERDTLTVSSPSVGRTDVGGSSGGVAFVPLTMLNVAQVRLDTASNDRGTSLEKPNVDEINVNSTSAGTTVLAFTGAGEDQINVGATSQNLDDLRGEFTVDAGDGNDRLTVYDRGNPNVGLLGTPTVYSVAADELIRKPSVTSPAAVIHYQDVSNLLLFTGDDGNVVNVTSAPPQTEIVSGAAGDTLTLDDRATANSSSSSYDFYSSVNKTTFTLTDRTITRFNRSYTIQTDTYPDWDPRLPPPSPVITSVIDSQFQISYSNLRELLVYGGTVGSTYNVASTLSGTPVTINAGTPIDSVMAWRTASGSWVTVGQSYNQFNVGGGGTVEFINSPLRFNGSGPDNRLTLNDANATRRDSVTVTPTTVGLGTGDQFFGPGAGLTYSDISALTLNLSTANDNSLELTPSANTVFTVNGNSVPFQAGRGASLNLDLTGVTNAVNTPSSPGSGQWTFDNRQPVTYANIAAQTTIDASQFMRIESGRLLIRGGTGASDDIITVWQEVGSLNLLWISVQVGSNQPLVRSFVVSDFDVVDIDSGDGTDVINIRNTPANVTTTVVGGPGNDTVSIGNAANTLDDIRGVLTILDETNPTLPSYYDANTLNINDQGNTVVGQRYTLNATSLDRSGAALITFVTGYFETLKVNAGGGGNHIRVSDTPGQYATTFLQSGSGADRVDVLATGFASFLYLSNTGGDDLFRLGSPSESLTDKAAHNGTMANVQGAVYPWNSSGTTMLVMDNSGDQNAHPNVSIDQWQLTGLSPSYVYWGVNSVVLHAGGPASGTGNTINLNGYTAWYPTEIFTGHGNDTINLNAPSADPYWAHSLIIHGQGGSDTLNFNDQAATDNPTYTLAASSVTRTAPFAGYSWNKVVTVNYDSVENLAVKAGSSDDTFKLQGPQSVRLTIDSAGGSDMLDYSAYTTAVTVNLATGAATDVLGGALNLENVTGGAGNDTLTGNAADNLLRGNGGNDLLTGSDGNDILVGGDGKDTLSGGNGRDLLIGGLGADALSGGAGDDILIGGRTSYDVNDAALLAVMAEWSRTDLTGTSLQKYQTRINDLRNGGATARNGAYRLNNTTVFDDGANDTLTGGGDYDWFWAALSGASKDKTDRQSSTEVVN